MNADIIEFSLYINQNESIDLFVDQSEEINLYIDQIKSFDFSYFFPTLLAAQQPFFL